MLIISEVIGKDFLLEMHDKGNVGDDYADNDNELLEQIPRYFVYLKDDMSLKICFQFRLLHAICKPKKASSCRKQDHSEVWITNTIQRLQVQSPEWRCPQNWYRRREQLWQGKGWLPVCGRKSFIFLSGEACTNVFKFGEFSPGRVGVFQWKTSSRSMKISESSKKKFKICLLCHAYPWGRGGVRVKTPALDFFVILLHI